MIQLIPYKKGAQVIMKCPVSMQGKSNAGQASRAMMRSVVYLEVDVESLNEVKKNDLVFCNGELELQITSIAEKFLIDNEVSCLLFNNYAKLFRPYRLKHVTENVKWFMNEELNLLTLEASARMDFHAKMIIEK